MTVYLLLLSSRVNAWLKELNQISESLIGVFMGGHIFSREMQLASDRHGCCFASEALLMQQLFKYSICFSPLSVTIMKFARANILACVYQWPTTDSLWAPFPRARQKNRLLKSFPKSRVSFALNEGAFLRASRCFLHVLRSLGFFKDAFNVSFFCFFC